MSTSIEPGLGELLRHMVELTDGSADTWYREQDFNYRPRYTPIMRALKNGPASVSDIKETLSITQGAVSQSIKLMLEDGLIEKRKGEDARQSIISLTRSGTALIKQLQPHWDAMFRATEALEQEIRLPLTTSLKRSVQALEQKSYADRISRAKSSDTTATVDGQARENRNFFQDGGERYANYRPKYPPELAESLSSLTKEQTLALDLGCGNGQFTSLLAPYFDQVIGTDSSQSQLEFAQQGDKITYRQEPAEQISLPDNSVDLITVAQAAHWFDLDVFYAEVQRVAKQDAIIALISYGVPYIADHTNAVFQKGYWQDTHEYWPAERTHVETGYSDLYFPFESIAQPNLSYQKKMGIEHFINYITTWSAYARAKDRGDMQRFEIFFDALREVWMNDIKEVVWPISLRIGRIK